MGRDGRLGLGLSPPVDEQQRQYGRRDGPSRDLRASHALRFAHRVRRQAHGAGGSLRRQAIQLTERRRREERRQRLVQRSELRASTRSTKATRRRARSALATSIRLDAASGRVTVVASDFSQPNGLAFSPDESLLYIVDTGLTHEVDGPHHVRRFKVSGDGASISGGEVFATCPAGVYDGLRVDAHGNLWLSAGDGVHCHAPDGSLLGKIAIPEAVANLCFGGPKLNRLFICGTTSLYSVFLNTRAAGLLT
jgi:hypothetical protein